MDSRKVPEAGFQLSCPVPPGAACDHVQRVRAGRKLPGDSGSRPQFPAQEKAELMLWKPPSPQRKAGRCGSPGLLCSGAS